MIWISSSISQSTNQWMAIDPWYPMVHQWIPLDFPPGLAALGGAAVERQRQGGPAPPPGALGGGGGGGGDEKWVKHGINCWKIDEKWMNIGNEWKLTG